MNNPLEPFFPLQQFPLQAPQVDKKTKEWENSLINILIPKVSTRKNNKTRSRKSRV